MDLIKVFSLRAWIVTDLLRYLFLFLDGIIYGAISPLFQSTMKLTSIRNLFTDDTFNIVDFVADRIYVFLALFMFFKLVFSIVTMIANPDAISDKQKGMGKVLTNSVLTVVLVIVMPIIFQLAYNVQDIIVNQGVLSSIFIAPNESGNTISMDSGQKIAKSVFKIFIGKNPDVKNTNKEVLNATNNFNKEQNSVGIEHFYDGVITNHEGNYYRIYYVMVVSTIVGVMLLIAFIKMAIEIALRSIKLLVMEVISPIAVISFVDPQSATKGIFSKWMSITLKTYLSLFTRLAILFFSTSLMSSIDFEKFAKLEDSQLGIFELIFVVLAFVAFMQSAPKMLEEIFGYKPSEDSKAIGGIVGGALGFGAGAVTSSIQGARAGAAGEQGMRKIWGGLKGMGKGAASGGAAGYKAGSKSGKDGGVGLGGMWGASRAANEQFKKSDDYKTLQHAQGLDKSKKEQAKYESKKPKWADTDNVAAEEAKFRADNASNASLISDYDKITGPGEEKLKYEFRKKESQKAANKEVYSSQYANAKNDILDKAFEKKHTASKINAAEINVQKASRLVDRQSSASEVQNKIAAQQRIMSDTSISAEQRAIAAAEESALQSNLTRLNSEIATLSTDLISSGVDAAMVSSGLALDATSNTSALLKADYETISIKLEKAQSDFKTLQEEPRYSSDVKLDKQISRGKLMS